MQESRFFGIPNWSSHGKNSETQCYRDFEGSKEYLHAVVSVLVE